MKIGRREPGFVIQIVGASYPKFLDRREKAPPTTHSVIQPFIISVIIIVVHKSATATTTTIIIVIQKSTWTGYAVKISRARF